MSVHFFSAKQPWGYLEVPTNMKTKSEAALCLNLQANQLSMKNLQ